jgi:hypothetical protein
MDVEDASVSSHSSLEWPLVKKTIFGKIEFRSGGNQLAQTYRPFLFNDPFPMTNSPWQARIDELRKRLVPLRGGL